LHSDDVATELTLWEQSSRLQLNFSDAHNVRVTQNLTIPKDTQHDLRVALIWESYL
jgi:hypothetical protein